MLDSISISKKVADFLLQIKAIKLQPQNPFTWASGLKSPIYCDNRITLSYPEIRDFLRDSLANQIVEKYGKPDSIAGVATAGIAQGVLVADKLKLPYAYVRPEPKDHGARKQIEGFIRPGASVVVIEDLISTGGSSAKVIELLKNSGYEVKGLAAIFSYDFNIAEETFKALNCPFFALSGYAELLQLALEHDYISDEELTALKQWRIAPDKWTYAHSS